MNSFIIYLLFNSYYHPYSDHTEALEDGGHDISSVCTISPT